MQASEEIAKVWHNGSW